MKTTIEEIDGKLYTVVWKGESFDLYKVCNPYTDQESGVIYFASSFGSITATALPALPKHPTEDDVQLLYRYMSEGIYPRFITDPRFSEVQPPSGWRYEDVFNRIGHDGFDITHAADKDGNKVEAAIK